MFGIAFFLGLSGLTLYLGSWQLQRKQRKERSVRYRAAGDVLCSAALLCSHIATHRTAPHRPAVDHNAAALRSPLLASLLPFVLLGSVRPLLCAD